MTTIFIAVAIIVLGIVMSALYSGLETGLYSINRIRLDVRAAANSPSAQNLKSLIEKPTRMLAVLLVCNNIANYLASYGTAKLLDQTSFGPWLSIGVNAICLIPILFIFGEVLPKDLYRVHADSWTYRCSPALRWADHLLRWTGIVPVVSGIGSIARRLLGTESDIEPSPRRRFGLLFKEGLGTGTISDEQTTLADRALAMRSLNVGNEMVPWSRVTHVNLGTPPRQRNAILKHSPYTRIPVVDNTGAVQGVLPAITALLERDKSTNELMQTVHFLPATMPVSQAIRDVRESGRSMAIVTSSSSKRPLGIVTLKDLVEPLVGELAVW